MDLLDHCFLETIPELMLDAGPGRGFLIASLDTETNRARIQCSAELFTNHLSDTVCTGFCRGRENRGAPPKRRGSERLKSFFDFADKFQKLRGVRDAGMPAQVALDQIVGLLNACTRNNISSSIAIAAHQPQMVRHRGRSGHVVS